MSSTNEDLAYMCNQFKKGLILGAGFTLFSSGIIIGVKTASFIIDIVVNISSDGIIAIREAADRVVQEEALNENKIISNKEEKD